MVLIKRVYEPAVPEDGRRYLVDRLWPRGVGRDRARLDGWLREIAPSDELRKWFGHDPARWDEFRTRYREELSREVSLLEELRREVREGTITLLYAARDGECNNAVVLRELLEQEPDGTGSFPT